MRVSTWLVVLSSLGCGHGSHHPTAPSPNDASLSPIPTVSGVVYDATSTGLIPLAGAAIDVSPEYATFPPTATTDLSGRYATAAAGDNLKVVATKAGYSQPCRAPVNTGASTGDVYLVSDTVLSTTGVPPSMPVVLPLVNGHVFERAASGRASVPGATIIADFSGGFGWAPSATTRSNAEGDFLLCNMRVGVELIVTANGFKPTILLLLRDNGVVDVELQR